MVIKVEIIGVSSPINQQWLSIQQDYNLKYGNKNPMHLSLIQSMHLATNAGNKSIIINHDTKLYNTIPNQL